MTEPEDVRLELGLDATTLRRSFSEKLLLQLMKFRGVATRNDHYLALSYVIRDRILDRWARSAQTFLFGDHRTVIYLSAEYLLGRALGNNLINMGLWEPTR